MAIDHDLNTREHSKFVESSSVAGKPVTAVANPDGTDIGSHSEHTEDTPHTSGDKGILVFAIRNGENQQLTSHQGDFSPISVDDTGRPQIIIIDGNTKVHGNVSSGDPDSAEPVKVGGKYNAAPIALTDGDRGDIQLDENGYTKVNVTNLPKSIQGPGIPNVDSYSQVAVNLAAGANQVLVAAPGANKQIWVYGVVVTTNVAGTVSFQDEDDTAISGVMPISANSGLGLPPSGNFSMPLWKLATNKALEIDVVTSEIDGWINYAIISV